MQKIISAAVILLLAGCTAPVAQRDTFDLLNAEMQKAADSRAGPAQPDAVAASLLPPLKIEMPAARPAPEERFNLAFNNVPAAQFFNAIVAIAVIVSLLGIMKNQRGVDSAAFEAAVTLNRKDFGITWNRTLDAGGVLLGDEVYVSIALETRKDMPPAPPSAQ